MSRTLYTFQRPAVIDTGSMDYPFLQSAKTLTVQKGGLATTIPGLLFWLIQQIENVEFHG